MVLLMAIWATGGMTRKISSKVQVRWSFPMKWSIKRSTATQDWSHLNRSHSFIRSLYHQSHTNMLSFANWHFNPGKTYPNKIQPQTSFSLDRSYLSPVCVCLSRESLGFVLWPVSRCPGSWDTVGPAAGNLLLQLLPALMLPHLLQQQLQLPAVPGD